MADDYSKGIGIQLDFVLESQNSIQSKVQNYINSLNKLSRESIKLDIGLKNPDFERQLQQINNIIEKTGINMKSMGSVNVSDLQRAITLTQELNNKSNFNSINPRKDIIQEKASIEEIISIYERLGNVKIKNQKSFTDAEQLGKLKEVTFELERQNGIVEKMTYTRNNAVGQKSNGEVTDSNFKLKSLSSVDNSEKLAQQEKQYQQEIEKTIELINKKINTMAKNNILPKDNIDNLKNQASNLSMKSDEVEFSEVNRLISEQIVLETQLSNTIKQTESNIRNATKEQRARSQAELESLKIEQELSTLKNKGSNNANDYVNKANVTLDNLKNKYGSNIPVQELELFRQKLQQIKTDGKEIKSVQDFNKLKRSIEEARIEYMRLDSQTRQNAGGFFSTMKDNIGKFMMYFGGAGGVLMAFNQLKEGVRTVVEMESALTDLNKVVDMTGSQMEMMTNSALNLGQALGQSGTDVMKSMAEFGRVNKNLSDIQELSKVAVMAGNVTTMSAEESAKALNTTMIDFKMNAQDSMQILNSWNEIQNNYRTSAQDMADSIGRVGVMAKQTGMSLDQLNGITTALVSATGQSGNTAGTALKTILARTYKVGEEGQDSNVEKVLGQYNIAVRDAQGNLIPFMNILGQLDEKFKTLTQSQKLEIEQSMAGVHHFSQMASLIENYKVALDATNSSINSQGSAEKENQKYLQTTEAQYKQLVVAMEKLALATFNTDVFKSVLNGAESAINGLSKFMNIYGSMPVIITTAIIAMKAFNGQLAVTGTTTSLKGLFAMPEIIKRVTVNAETGIKTVRTELSMLGTQFDLTKAKAVALNTVKSIGWGMAIGFAIQGVSKLIDSFTNLDEKLKQSNIESTQRIVDNAKALEEASSLLSKSEQKQAEINKSSSVTEQTAKKKELLDIQRQLAQVLPNSISGFDEEGKAISANTELIKAQIEAKKSNMLQDAQAFMDNKRNKTQIENIESTIARYDEIKKKYKELQLMQAKGEKEYETKSVVSGYDRNTGQNETKTITSKTNVVDEMASLSKEMQDIATFVSQYNTNANALNKSQMELTGITESLYRTFLLESSATQESSEAIKSKSQAYESFKQQVDDATSKVTLLKSAQDNISNNGINQSGLQPILTMYPELLSNMNSQENMQDAINKKIAEQEQIAKTSYDSMIQHSADAYGLIEKSAKDMAEDFEKYRKVTQEAIGKLTELKDIQKDLQVNGMNSDSLKDVVKTYPELLAYMNDQNALQAKINEMIKQQEEVARQAYVNTLKNNAEMYNRELQNAQLYYEAKLRYNNDFQVAVNNLIKSYVGNNASGYEVDLKNFKSLNEAKAEILRRMEQAIGNANTNMVQQVGALNAGYGNVAEVQKAYDAMKALEAKQKQMGIDFDDLSIRFASIPETIDTASDISGVGKDKAEKEQKVADLLKLEIDRYLNINGQLRDIEGSLTRINTLKETTPDAWTYVNALQQEMDLLRQKKNTLQQLWNEQKREYDELYPKLVNSGFQVQGNLIANFRQRIQELENYANQLASAQDDAGQKEFERRKAMAEDLKSTVERFMDLSHNAMQSTLSDIQAIEKEVQDIQKTRISQIQTVEAKMTEVYKKMVDERINAINREKDARISAINKAQVIIASYVEKSA